MAKRTPSTRSIRKAIQALAREWLGKANVVAIYEEERDEELVIVIRVSEILPSVSYPRQCMGLPVVTEKGKPYVVEQVAPDLDAKGGSNPGDSPAVSRPTTP